MRLTSAPGRTAVAAVRVAGPVGGVVTGLGLATAALGRAAVLEGQRLWARRAALAFDDLVVGCALAVLALVLCWLCLAVLLTTTSGLLHGTNRLVTGLARATTPVPVRRLLGGVCGAALLTAPVTAPVSAAPGDRAPLPAPDRPVGAVLRAAPTHVCVHPGDSLWAIAARHLPAHADDAAIAAAWPVWFARNRARLGPDPHLIHPRKRLVVPQRFRRTAKETPDDHDHRPPPPRACGRP